MKSLSAPRKVEGKIGIRTDIVGFSDDSSLSVRNTSISWLASKSPGLAC
jgi:hypothetical protein